MIHASLCTGIGAGELVATWLGWENAFSCEINTFCQTILKYHYPSTQHYGNIFGTDFSEWKNRIDILTAGFPCQPFSIAGQRQGSMDNRYLWPEVLRVIGEVKPRWFVGENVAGINSMVLPGEEIKMEGYKDIFDESYLQTKMYQQFIVERICQDLERIGYSVQPVIIPACAVGAPHRRDRIWFIANANSNDARRCEYGEIGCEEKENKGNKEERERLRCDVERACDEGITTNTNSPKLQKRFKARGRAHSTEIETGVDNGNKRFSGLRDASNTHKFNGDISRFCASEFPQQQSSGIFSNIPDWQNFPTQSPVCCGDDGLPGGLSGITVSKHREESIKAYGNTIVPQVIFEIFKSIQEIEK